MCYWFVEAIDFRHVLHMPLLLRAFLTCVDTSDSLSSTLRGCTCLLGYIGKVELQPNQAIDHTRLSTRGVICWLLQRSAVS